MRIPHITAQKPIFQRHSSPPTAHLPVALRRLALQLDQPILLAVKHGAVVHGDDEGPSQQGPGGPAAHHGAQHRLAVLHRGPGGAQSEQHALLTR